MKICIFFVVAANMIYELTALAGTTCGLIPSADMLPYFKEVNFYSLIISYFLIQTLKLMLFIIYFLEIYK